MTAIAQNKIDNIGILPHEILLKIGGLLPLSEALKLKEVCRKMNRLFSVGAVVERGARILLPEFRALIENRRIKEITQIRELDIDFDKYFKANPLSKREGNVIKLCKKLEHFGFCPFTGKGLPQFLSLGDKPTLSHLKIAYMSGVSSLIDEKSARQIRFLDLNGGREDQGLDFLSQCTALEELNLKNFENLTDKTLAPLSKCLALRKINLERCCRLTGDGLVSLAHLPLYDLSLSDCRLVGDAALAHLARCRTLRHLNLCYCLRVTGKGLEYLKNLQLYSLDLSKCSESICEGFTFLKRHPLRELSLNWCKSLNDEGMMLLPTKFLETFRCTNGEHMVSITGWSKLKDSPLRHLDLAYVDISDEILGHLPLKRLKFLALDSSHITDAGVECLLGSPVETLSLNLCRKLTDKSLAHLNHLPLVRLDIRGCPFTDQGLDQLELPLLKELVIDTLHGRGPTPEGIARFQERHPSCKCGDTVYVRAFQ